MCCTFETNKNSRFLASCVIEISHRINYIVSKKQYILLKNQENFSTYLMKNSEKNLFSINPPSRFSHLFHLTLNTPFAFSTYLFHSVYHLSPVFSSRCSTMHESANTRLSARKCQYIFAECLLMLHLVLLVLQQGPTCFSAKRIVPATGCFAQSRNTDPYRIRPKPQGKHIPIYYITFKLCGIVVLSVLMPARKKERK